MFFLGHKIDFQTGKLGKINNLRFMLFKINKKSDKELRKSMGLKRASNGDYTKPMHKNLDSGKTVGGGEISLNNMQSDNTHTIILCIIWKTT